MKYFIMLDGQCTGPVELYLLPNYGVRPDTYVWHKGLDDWHKAEDDPDVCRMMRLRLAGMPYGAPEDERPAAPHPAEGPDTDNTANYPPIARGYLPPDVDPLPPPGHFEPDTSAPPVPMMLMAVLVTLFCFPPTGFVALWYAWRARSAWEAANTSDDLPGIKEKPSNTEERERLRSDAHEYARLAKMWTGITFFLGLIVTAAFMMARL